jgi:hypothetical protein
VIDGDPGGLTSLVPREARRLSRVTPYRVAI